MDASEEIERTTPLWVGIIGCGTMASSILMPTAGWIRDGLIYFSF
jgi:hypothetical protein